MSVPFLLYTGVRLGLDIYKSKPKKHIPKEVEIINVDGTAQSKLMNSIEQFIKHSVLVKLKRGASFAAHSVVTTLKWIAIIGAIGLVLYKLKDVIIGVIDFAKHVNEKYHIIQNIPKFIDEWNRCKDNFMIFLYENWDKNLNLKEKMHQVVIDSWSKITDTTYNMCNALKECCSNLWYGILNMFANLNKSQDKDDENIDLSKMQIRSPFDPDTVYTVNSPELKGDKLKDPHENDDQVDNSDVAVEGKLKADESMKPSGSGVDQVWNQKTNLRNTMNKIGLGQTFNEIFSGRDKKDVEDANNKITDEVSTSNTTKKVINQPKTNTLFNEAAANKINFDTASLTLQLNYFKQLNKQITSIYDADFEVLKNFKTTLTKQYSS